MKGMFKTGGVPLGYEEIFDDNTRYDCVFVPSLDVVRVYGSNDEYLDVPAREVDIYGIFNPNADFAILESGENEVLPDFSWLADDITH